MLVLIALLLVLFIFFVAIFWSLPSKLPFNPHGKHALVTGGSRGIGKSICAQLLAAGCRNVSLIARDQAALEAAKSVLEEKCAAEQSVHIYALDLNESPERIQIEYEAGPVDLLVNNAGTVLQGAFDELPEDAFELQMRTNYLSAVKMTRALVGQMKSRGAGHIAFVSSAAGQCAIWGYSAYSPSKFALRGFADALQQELLAYGIGVSILFPPNTATEGFEEELRTMPEEVRQISNSAGVFAPQDVATAFVRSLCRGEFAITVGVEGKMLGLLTAGASPEPNALLAIAQVLLAGLLRGVMLIYIGQFNAIVRNCHKKKTKT